MSQNINYNNNQNAYIPLQNNGSSNRNEQITYKYPINNLTQAELDRIEEGSNQNSNITLSDDLKYLMIGIAVCCFLCFILLLFVK